VLIDFFIAVDGGIYIYHVERRSFDMLIVEGWSVDVNTISEVESYCPLIRSRTGLCYNSVILCDAWHDNKPSIRSSVLTPILYY
jgi:hypothetical protein